MPGPPSPPPEPPTSAPPRQSLRWDTAQRACRVGDLKTLKFLFESAQLFEDAPALRKACLSGAWGTGREDLLTRPFSTTDSIRLHTMLLSATERGHVNLVRFILQEFPAKELHVAEWQVVVNAISKGSIELLEPFIEVDPGLMNMFGENFGSCFTILFSFVEEKEMHLPVVEFLIKKGADIGSIPCLLGDCAVYSTVEVLGVLLDAGAKMDGVCSALCLAAYHGKDEMVEFLLGTGEDVNGVYKAGLCDQQLTRNSGLETAETGPPLYFAAAGGKVDMAHLLLAKGADWNIPASDGKTALGIAQAMGFDGVVAILEDNTIYPLQCRHS